MHSEKLRPWAWKCCLKPQASGSIFNPSVTIFHSTDFPAAQQHIYLGLGYQVTLASFRTASVKTLNRFVKWISKQWTQKVFHFSNWWTVASLTTVQKWQDDKDLSATLDCLLKSVGLTNKISSLEWSASSFAINIYPQAKKSTMGLWKNNSEVK